MLGIQNILQMLNAGWIDDRFYCVKCKKVTTIAVEADSCYVHSRSLGLSFVVTNRVKVIAFCASGHKFEFTCTPEQLVRITENMRLVLPEKPL